MRAALIWAVLAAAILLPLAQAGTSPLLQWRQPIYIAAGLAGVLALGLLLVQPLLVAGALPGLSGLRGRRVHRLVGGLLLLAVVLHVGGLWLTSPPDVIDAVLLRSPTSFSVWGVAALWALMLAAVVATRRRQIPPRVWRMGHAALAGIAVGATVIHALLIEGTMDLTGKVALGGAAIAATGWAPWHLRRRIWPRGRP